LLIVTISTAITFLTGLSLSALATNMRIGGGGAYFIISRSLGLEAGAAIGIPLFFAQAIGIAFYIAGFAEAVVDIFPLFHPKIVGLVALFALTVLAYVSADLALKTQFLILAAIVVSLVSFFLGGEPSAAQISAGAVLSARQGFWVVFAVFFPAVTGIEAGIAMSGDLKDPGRSLPLGTLAAVVTGYILYMAIPVFLATVVTDERLLLTKPLIMRDVARFGEPILVGVWAASLSSAMGALLGAPRTLQALARDGVLPRVLGRGFGPGNDPRIATALSFAVAVVCILAGDINVLAPVLSMFFLTSYGLLNASAGFEQLIGAPSWRPKFRVHTALPLVGAFGCIATMLMINSGATFVAVFVAVGVFFMMKRRTINVQWGDMRHGILMLIARAAIYRLSSGKPHERTWKPNLLVFSGTPTSRWYLVELAQALSRGGSWLTIATVVPSETWLPERVESTEKSIRDFLAKRDTRALVKVFPSKDVLSGMEALIRAYGFGPVVPNTILVGETERRGNYERFVSLIQLMYRSRRNLIMVREGDLEIECQPKEGCRIDVWWGGLSENAGLMLILAYLLRKHPSWEHARLVVKTIVKAEEEKREATERLDAFLTETRLQSEVDVIVQTTGDLFELIRQSSQGAALVFLGIRAPQEDESVHDYCRYYEGLLDATDTMPPTALVLAAEDIAFKRVIGIADTPL
jgi:amino acid transporter